MGKSVYGRLTKLLNERDASNQEGVTAEIWKRTRIEGKPILVRHNWSDPGPVGKFKRSWIEQDKSTGEYFGCIEGEIYDTPAGINTLKEVDAGILHSWSVSVIQGNLALGPADLNREVLEGSLVPDPQEQGTQVVVRHSADGKNVPVQNLSLRVYTIQDDSEAPRVSPVPAPAVAPVQSPASEPEKKTEQNPVDTRAETTGPQKAVVQPPSVVVAATADTPMADAKPTDSAPAPQAAKAAAAATPDQGAAKKAAAPQLSTGVIKVSPAAKKEVELDPIEGAKGEEMEGAEEVPVAEVPVVEAPKKAVPAAAAPKPALKANKPQEKKAPVAEVAAEKEASSTPIDYASKIADLVKVDPEMATFLKEVVDKQRKQDEYIAKDMAEKAKRETEARDAFLKERTTEHDDFIARSRNHGIEVEDVEMEVNVQMWQSEDPAHQVKRGLDNKYLSRIEELDEEIQSLKKARVERPSATGGAGGLHFTPDVISEALRRADPAAAAQQEPKRKAGVPASQKLGLPQLKPGQKVYSHSKGASQPQPGDWVAARMKNYVYDPTTTIQSQAKLREQYKIPSPNM